MKLYIFEPHEWEWDYYGGAIGIIAETFDEAVKTIITDDKIRAKQEVQKPSLYTKSVLVNTYRRYWPKYFQRSPDTFKKDRSDQWLLTHEIQLTDDEQQRILFDIIDGNQD